MKSNNQEQSFDTDNNVSLNNLSSTSGRFRRSGRNLRRPDIILTVHQQPEEDPIHDGILLPMPAPLLPPTRFSRRERSIAIAKLLDEALQLSERSAFLIDDHDTNHVSQAPDATSL
jgi:hypothetical protein